jgi:hypothetical protein
MVTSTFCHMRSGFRRFFVSGHRAIRAYTHRSTTRPHPVSSGDREAIRELPPVGWCRAG